MAFQVGQPVLYINGWDISTSHPFIYRYGTVRAGFIHECEYIPARNLYLYTVGTVDPNNETKIVFRTIGEHLVFNVHNIVQAVFTLKEVCEKPDLPIGY